MKHYTRFFKSMEDGMDRQWLWGSAHTHSEWSDGLEPVAELSMFFKRFGMDFLPWQDLAEVPLTVFRLIPVCRIAGFRWNAGF
jgi:hypothetical protein